MGKADSAQPGEFNYLDILFSTGRYGELEGLARVILQKRPAEGIVWKLFGLSLQMQGKEALAALQKAAELLPQDAEAHANLAGAMRASGRFEEAAESGQRALRIRPNFIQAHNNLGLVFNDMGRVDDAEACFRRALQIEPDFLPALNNLAYTQRDTGKSNEAKESFRRSLALNPANVEAMLSLGSLYMESGEMAEAETQLRKVLEIRPDHLSARYMLAQIGKTKHGDDNLAALIAVGEAVRSGQLSLDGPDAISLHFALGKCFDDIGDYEQAFPHFMEGCKLKRATFEYSPEIMRHRVDDIIRVFDQATIARLSGSGVSSPRPVFVLGMPRSGTTLIEQIISSHPDVYGAGELPYLLEIAQCDVKSGVSDFPDNVLALSREMLANWGQEYAARLGGHASDARHITDKMPENFFAVGLIHVMLPNAKIIHVKRSPEDTCFSCFTTLFNNGLEHTYDLAELGRYYADYARLMAHWRKVLPEGAFLEVQYEDVVADQERQARRVLDYCGLEWNDACLDFHKNRRTVSTASYAQVRKPIYRSAVERWRPYRKFLGPLLDELGDSPIR